MTAPEQDTSAPITLTVDVGGQGIKARPIRGSSEPIADRVRVKTPRPATSHPVIETIAALVERHHPYDRITVGFPGVVVQGVVMTAPNLDGRWKGVHIQQQLAERTGVPVRVINDADMQGYGAIAGKGFEMIITLGTGMGAAMFLNGQLVPNLELGHHPFEKLKTYEERLGQAALDQVGRAQWNRRLARAVTLLQRIFNFDTLYIGGGNARCIKVELPENVVIVRNDIAFRGGARLWELTPG